MAKVGSLGSPLFARDCIVLSGPSPANRNLLIRSPLRRV